MNQSLIAGILLVLFGLIAGGKPDAVWKAAEKWKSEGGRTASPTYILICRILGLAFIVVGILLILGIVK